GTFIVDIGTTVGSGGNTYNTALTIGSNVFLRGVGFSSIIRLKGNASRAATALTNCVIGNLNPDTGNSNVKVGDLIIDCNLQHQGPAGYRPSISGGQTFLCRGLNIFTVTGGRVDDLVIQNCNDI